jgi:hypothetical protein
VRVLVRAQEPPRLMEFTANDLSRAITDGIRGAEIANGINAQRRSVERFKAIDEATEGALCKHIDEIIKAEAALLSEALSGAVPPDVKAVRTEVGRLGAYLRFRDQCHNPPTG